VILKTPDFSLASEFSVGTGELVVDLTAAGPSFLEESGRVAEPFGVAQGKL
jgi:hypothetical protein